VFSAIYGSSFWPEVPGVDDDILTIGEPAALLEIGLGSGAVQPGTQRWQGAAGWCVCEGSATSAMPDQNIAVRKLQGDESRRDFKAGFLIPLSRLVEAMSHQLSEQVRTEIDALINATARAYAGNGGT
jgi:hypothetical protein